MNGDWDEEVDFVIDAKRGSALLLDALLRFTGKQVVRSPVLQEAVPLKRIGGLTPIAEVQKLAAQICEQSVRIMTNGERDPAAVQARQVAMYLAVIHLGKSNSEVARRFNVDRTTVYHAVKRVCKVDDLWQKAVAVKAMLAPVDNGDSDSLPLRNSQEHGSKEHSGNKQERLAA